MTETELISKLEGPEIRTIDRAIALLWMAGRDDPSRGRNTRDLCAVLEASGHPRQNVSRMRRQLQVDKRAAKVGKDDWRLHATSRRELDLYYKDLDGPVSPPDSDSVLPRVLFHGTRGYIERVVRQINKSYDAGLFDCCAVMCRRLVETMIIELYEARGRAGEVKGSDGHFLMLSGLMTFLENDSTIHLSRSTTQGLRDFKKLGDLSAHSRRFNAERPDIDRVRDGLRVGAQELLRLAGL